MKKFINLLPADAQRDIVVAKLHSQVLNLFVWIILSLIITAVFFLAARLYLHTQISRLSGDIERQRQVVSQDDNRQLKEELRRLNVQLANLVRLEEGQAQWSEILIELARLLPHDISLDSAVLDRTTREIRISGLARTRASVLLLHSNLLTSTVFTGVDFPYSNITMPTNVSFRYKFYVRPEALLKNS